MPLRFGDLTKPTSLVTKYEFQYKGSAFTYKIAVVGQCRSDSLVRAAEWLTG